MTVATVCSLTEGVDGGTMRHRRADQSSGQLGVGSTLLVALVAGCLVVAGSVAFGPVRSADC